MSTDLVPMSEAGLRLSAPLQSWLSEVSRTENSGLSRAGKIGSIKSVDDLWGIFDEGYQAEMKARIISGLALLRIREISDRDFAQGLRTRGFSAGSAYRLMHAASLYLVLPDLEAIHRACELDIRAVTELGKFLGEEGFSQLAQGKRVSGLSFEEARALTTREIESLRKGATEKAESIRKLAKKLADAEHRADMAEADAQVARGEAPDLPPWARAVRTEAACASEAMMAAVDTASEAFWKAVETPLNGMSKAERARHLQAAAHLMLTNMKAAAAKAWSFATEVAEHVGDVDDLAEMPVLSDAEIEELVALRDEILETAQAEYENREVERANGKRDGFKKGRGRPQIAKSKAASSRTNKKR